MQGKRLKEMYTAVQNTVEKNIPSDWFVFQSWD